MEGNAVDGHREGGIGEDLKRIAGFQRVLASAGAVGELPGWNSVVAERIIEPLYDLMAQGRDIGHIAAKDAGPNPARPGKSLHKLGVAARACVKRRVETQDAAFLDIGSWGQKYVVAKSDRQGIDFQVFQLNDGVELGDEKAGINN